MLPIETILVIVLTFATVQAGSLDDAFLKTFENDGDSKDTIIEFSPVIDKVMSHPALSSLQGDERRTKIVGLMQKHTKSMQLPVMNSLTTLGLADKATPYWIANKIAIKDAPLGSLKALSAIPGVFTIREAQTAKAFPVEAGSAFQAQDDSRNKRATTYQWGVEKIGAPIAFEHNITGKGVVLGVIDTGARYTHVALRTNYKNDAYSWKDAVNNKTTPYDDNGHGTHVMGTAVGTENGIGVAPGAKWIACKALDSQGSGSEAALTTCGQFMACPNNSSGSCTDYPNIVSNSWGGGTDNSFYNSVIESWIAMEIVPVFAIGNSGPICGSANSPGDQSNLISVGSTDSNDGVSSFSSRGPGGNVILRLFGLGTTKPEVAAPGRDIISADYSSDTGYRSLSGTSMATPHVAGASALILSTDLKLGFKGVRDRLEKTAVQKNAKNSCAAIFSPSQPNNEYGYGRISVPKALNIQ